MNENKEVAESRLLNAIQTALAIVFVIVFSAACLMLIILPYLKGW